MTEPVFVESGYYFARRIICLSPVFTERCNGSSNCQILRPLRALNFRFFKFRAAESGSHTQNRSGDRANCQIHMSDKCVTNGSGGYNLGQSCLSLPVHSSAITKSARRWAPAGWVKSIARGHKARARCSSKFCLPFATDPERMARFRREAQVLASLNHPHIGAIYGFEDSGGVHALVMELVEGPTLADRITTGAIPLDEALQIARETPSAGGRARTRHHSST